MRKASLIVLLVMVMLAGVLVWRAYRQNQQNRDTLLQNGACTGVPGMGVHPDYCVKETR